MAHNYCVQAITEEMLLDDKATAIAIAKSDSYFTRSLKADPKIK